jgi:peptidoglycan/LPS O-acetylase OafA/YrhL
VVWLQVAWAVAGDGWWLSWVVALFVPFLLGLALGTGPLHDALATRLLVLGGGLSYALYLVHSPLLYLFRDVVRFTGLLHLEPWPAYLAEVAFVPVMVLLAWGLYRFFEEPVRRRMVRLLGPATLVTTATVVPPPADDRQQETSRT